MTTTQKKVVFRETSYPEKSILKKRKEKIKDKNAIKIVLIGDGFVGKTCMILSYATDRWSTNYKATIYEKYEFKITVDNRPFVMEIVDTAGQDEHENLRTFAYPNADCFICCFSLISRNSLLNVSHKWLPEIRKHQAKAPIILVGTKLDIVEDSKNAKKTIQPHDRLVKKKHVDKVTSSKEFIDYVECSSISQKGLKRVFDIGGFVQDYRGAFSDLLSVFFVYFSI